MTGQIARLFQRPPDFVIGSPEAPYLRRWWVIPRNRWFNIYLHQFCRSDDDRALHDHPWINASVLLTGSYVEHVPGAQRLRQPWRPWAPWRVVFRGARAAHRIQLLSRMNFSELRWEERPVWTLFLTGPVVREWGFWCPQGWRHWRDFTAAHNKGLVGPGCD